MKLVGEPILSTVENALNVRPVSQDGNESDSNRHYLQRSRLIGNQRENRHTGYKDQRSKRDHASERNHKDEQDKSNECGY